jgi:YaiO family outer membrane protein
MRQRAEELRRAQRFGEALSTYRTLAQQDPANFEDRFWVAKLESWTGSLEAAESAFVKLVAERPDDYDSRIALADLHLWRGQTSAARSVLDGLSRSYPDDPEVLIRLGRVSQAAGNPQEARRHFARVIEVAPGSPIAHEAARYLALMVRWEAAVEYFGEQLPQQGSTNGLTISLACCSTDRFRWRSAGTLQDKLDRTEGRVVGEFAYRAAPTVDLRWSAYLAPGAELLPRQTYGLGLSHKAASRLVLSADYRFFDYHDASVHQIGPGFELYAGGHWLLAGNYRYAITRFSSAQDAVGDHAGSLALGYLYGGSNLLRVIAAFGAESFTQPSRDLIGEFQAHAIGAAWRQFLTPRVGFEVAYAHLIRSDDTQRDSYSLRVVQRW